MAQSIFDLSGKVALVTGASRGLGRSIAVGLAEAGAKIVITSRNLTSLEDTSAEIERVGGTSVPLVLDVSDVSGMTDQMSNLAAQLSGGLDILVNNAGYEEVCPSLDVSEDVWDRVVDTNLKGAFFCARNAARMMVDTGRGGAIINVCSLTSYVGVPTAVPYGSSKSGLLGMTRALSTEWAAHRIRVNAIAPGYFRTELTDQFYQNEDWQNAMLEKIPLGTFGDSNDLKGAVVFLASDASGYVTGQCIGIDGGYLASI
ncbi:SDR family NAD(P)-dependent oxidoreductase [Pararhizobium sp. IMCC21322]|uniref:SDR family NAD(P)-dependent oxidoreductase n=1 Tax=Pararhizobium sp. IMCC21322 TaxID=3067903 RepID=UPI002741023D|nr:glucose 1-dehydrogenase [Pararhizobium sp. IMCC21322]